MITQLIEAKEEKQLLRFRKQIKQLDLIVLDELGYVPTGKVGAELLFDVLSTAYVVLDRLARTHWNAVVGDRWLSPPALVREGSTPMFNHAEIEQYRDTGYCFVRSLFAPAEIDRLRSAAKSDRELDAHAFGRNDGEGGSVRLSLWNHPGDDIYGTFSRNRRVVDRVEQLLGDEPYHYHSKMIMKEARTGGAWAWHQDYGYWYENGVLYPNLCSVFIAVDPATKENGCLQVLEGSHQL